jgi:hypothetical protein
MLKNSKAPKSFKTTLLRDAFRGALSDALPDALPVHSILGFGSWDLVFFTASYP